MRRLGVRPNHRRNLSLAAAPGAGRRRASAGDCSGAPGRWAGLSASVTIHKSIAALLAALVTVLVFTMSPAAPADAQSGPQYAATPPTKGALYPDGQDDRWLLGGQWLYEADPGNVGVQDGWWRGVSGTAGWSPVTVPNSYNAGNLSAASMAVSVGWYRRDFTLPSSAFARYVPSRFRSWIVRFESVNYDATVWLNGHKLGSHAGAYLPFEFALTHVRKGVNPLIVRLDDRRDAAEPVPVQGATDPGRRPGTAPRELLHRQRRAQDHGHTDRADGAQRTDLAPARGQPPRAEHRDRRGADVRAARRARRVDARAGRDDHPRPLSAGSADRAARRPGRDPALVRGPRVPVKGQVLPPADGA